MSFGANYYLMSNIKSRKCTLDANFLGLIFLQEAQPENMIIGSGYQTNDILIACVFKLQLFLGLFCLHSLVMNKKHSFDDEWSVGQNCHYSFLGSFL
ncbi:hypothetical protein RJT34_24534 [Clitoria ternatea]|uniref:Uncharacterized protein n=1 Tax=Clitoria ternatea TaxID=43366 RepID=A0AAN9FQY1_CLITE